MTPPATVSSAAVETLVDMMRDVVRYGTGKRAVTHVRVIARLYGTTHVECTLETGRTHQIRVHLAESGTAGLAFGQGNGHDQALCPGGVANVKGTFNALCSYPVVGVEGSNPGLKAVTSTNATFGFIFEPLKAFNMSVDWYRIELKNDIISAASAGGLSNFVSTVRGPSAVLPVCTNTVTTGTCNQVNELTPVGYPAYSLYPYLNAGSTRTSGIDVDLRSKFDAGDFGQLRAELNFTYIAQYELEVAGTTYDLVGTHGPQSISGDTGNPSFTYTIP